MPPRVPVSLRRHDYECPSNRLVGLETVTISADAAESLRPRAGKFAKRRFRMIQSGAMAQRFFFGFFFDFPCLLAEGTG